MSGSIERECPEFEPVAATGQAATLHLEKIPLGRRECESLSLLQNLVIKDKRLGYLMSIRLTGEKLSRAVVQHV